MVGLLLAALVGSVLTSFTTSTTASAATQLNTRSAASAGALAGEKAGRKAGAAAGAKAGRKAAAMAGSKAAAAGEKAGRTAGAKAGAKAGRTAGARGGAKAGAKAGTTAGKKAGTAAGLKAARAAVGKDCGTNTYRKPNGTVWKCTLGENFDGNALNTTLWRVMTSDKYSFGKRPDCFVNDPDNIKVANGVLTLTSRREPAKFNCKRRGKNYPVQYSASMVSTYQKFSQAYGRFEFRAKLPYTVEDGVQTSFWLWPEGESGASWPASGEIDVMEWYSHFPDRVVPYLHHGNIFSQKDSTNTQCLVNRVQDWHTYLLEWTPSSITISYDGKQCLYRKGGAPFNKAYMISMFQGYGLKKNAPTSRTPAVSSAQIAWVRVWS